MQAGKISIVIVGFNAKEYLQKCLRALDQASTASAHEVILVDNRSTDGSLEMVRNQFPGVHIIENNFNAGFSAANNQGMHASGGEYIFLLNPDTEVEAHAIEKLLHALEQDKEAVVVVPRLLNS